MVIHSNINTHSWITALLACVTHDLNIFFFPEQNYIKKKSLNKTLRILLCHNIHLFHQTEICEIQNHDNEINKCRNQEGTVSRH
jgi:hypothetical protein